MEEKMDEKRRLRRHYKALRDSLPRERASALSGEICERLLPWEPFLQAEAVCFYHPIGNEANLLSAAQAALRLGKGVFFPRTEGAEIHFYQVTRLDQFHEGAFHVMEPPVGARPMEMPMAGRLLAFVPGVAFDLRKHRMGYGKGYYDRFFAQMPNVFKVGICYEMQLAEEIPAEPWDVPMDAVLTERRVYSESPVAMDRRMDCLQANPHGH